ncbi:hypothetical protein CYD33_027795, partial [Escherichia coli]
LQGKISSDGCLKKEQMVVSAIASTPQTIPGLRAERKVISKLSPRSYLKRSLIPIKKIETKIDSVECISIHRVDS